MEHELVAYLIHEEGKVSAMPTDELLRALRQVVEQSSGPPESMLVGNPAVYAFLQAVRQTMREVAQAEREPP